MKYKKFVVGFAAALLLAGNCFVFAAETQNTTQIEAVCDLPEIKVTVPESGKLFINPYEMPVEINGETIGAQIVSAPAAILNESVVPLQVTATVTGKIKDGSDMVLSSSSIDPDYTKKKAFIYFEMQTTNDPEKVTWDSEYNMDRHIVVRLTPKVKKKIVTLDAYDEDGRKKCYGAFRLTGNCAAAPKIPWTDADGVDVTIAFTFKATSKVE